MQPWPILEIIAVLAGAAMLVVGVPAFAVRFLLRSRAGSRWEALRERATALASSANSRDAGNDPDVAFTFHTDSGFLVFCTRTTHRPALPASVALQYLRELHRYNLMHRLIPYPGVIFVRSCHS